MGRRTKRFVLIALMLGATLGVTGTALAQLPPVPQPPPQVMNAVYTVEGVVYPVLFQGAEAAAPVANAGGFAIRPGCASVSGVAVIVAVAGPSLPISPFGVISPFFLLCGPAYEAGPADPYLHQADAAVGPQVGTQWNSVADKFKTTVKPAAAQYWSSACLAVSFAPPMSTFPGPTRRLHYADLLC